MDKTNELTYCKLFDTSKADRKNQAYEYFKRLYPDIEYNSILDCFEYKGILFNYFQSGVSLDGNDYNYMLVDKDDDRLWLFTYGDSEERWAGYLSMKNDWNNVEKLKESMYGKSELSFLYRMVLSIKKIFCF